MALETLQKEIGKRLVMNDQLKQIENKSAKKLVVFMFMEFCCYSSVFVFLMSSFLFFVHAEMWIYNKDHRSLIFSIVGLYLIFLFTSMFVGATIVKFRELKLLMEEKANLHTRPEWSEKVR